MLPRQSGAPSLRPSTSCRTHARASHSCPALFRLNWQHDQQYPIDSSPAVSLFIPFLLIARAPPFCASVHLSIDSDRQPLTTPPPARRDQLARDHKEQIGREILNNLMAAHQREEDASRAAPLSSPPGHTPQQQAATQTANRTRPAIPLSAANAFFASAANRKGREVASGGGGGGGGGSCESMRRFGAAIAIPWWPVAKSQPLAAVSHVRHVLHVL